jgi:adenylate cyclase
MAWIEAVELSRLIGGQMRQQTIAVESRVTVPNSLEELWPFVADANRMDHTVGLPAAQFTRIARPEGGEETWGEYRRWGMRIARWREYPFEWERPRYYSVVREYSSGPLTKFFGGAEMTAGKNGTTIRVFSEFTPRNLLGALLVRMYIAPLSMRRARRQYQDIGAFLAGLSLDPFPNLHAEGRFVHSAQIDRGMKRLTGLGAPSDASSRLRKSIEEGPDEDVTGMRPLELADHWHTDSRDTLQTFLKATEAGVLEMRWELLCPSCRGVKAEASQLKELNVNSYCSACNLPFAASVDEGIEARFYPNPAVREVNTGVYCVGSPMKTPHRHAQTTLNPHETRDWEIHLNPGRYLLRSPQSREYVRLQADQRADVEPVEVIWDADTVAPQTAETASGRALIRMTNQSDFARTVAIDDAHWSSTAATPSRLLTLPDFNRLFSAEALAPGIELSVGRVGLLFSDLAGSTSLYERAGEAVAFRLVTDHFQILKDAIVNNGGSLVKTIGDAVMAAFPDGSNALSAALAIQREIRTLDTRDLVEPERLVKIGVHSGPSYLVTLNDRLDYFGTTVNVAARAQHEARGGEVVATQAVMEEIGGALEDPELSISRFEVHLRGIDEPVTLYRITYETSGEQILSEDVAVPDAIHTGKG